MAELGRIPEGYSGIEQAIETCEKCAPYEGKFYCKYYKGKFAKDWISQGNNYSYIQIFCDAQMNVRINYVTKNGENSYEAGIGNDCIEWNIEGKEHSFNVKTMVERVNGEESYKYDKEEP